jgi:putative peptidoglycan lipid II flippase
MGAGLAWAAHALDWLATAPALRVLWLAGVLLGAALAYFGTLLASGLDLRPFARRR